MKLTEKAIEQILKTPQCRIRIALAMKLGEAWIAKGLKENKEDGFLTKASALKVIKQETGMLESEILTEAANQEMEKQR